MDDRQHYHLLTETYKMWQGTWMLTYLMPELREQDDIGYIAGGSRRAGSGPP